MITGTLCTLLLTKSWTYYTCIFFTYETFFLIVRLPLYVEFDMFLEADAAIWNSDIDLVNA